MGLKVHPSVSFDFLASRACLSLRSLLISQSWLRY